MMTFIVHELSKAKQDKRQIFEWLFERSPEGAVAWLNAYDQMVQSLTTIPTRFPLARESNKVDLEVRQILFKTRRGRFYRAVFHIDDTNVYILRVRGPGQSPVPPEDLLK